MAAIEGNTNTETHEEVMESTENKRERKTCEETTEEENNREEIEEEKEKENETEEATNETSAMDANIDAMTQVEDLADLLFQTTLIHSGVDDGMEMASNKGLKQGYCVVPSAERLVLLYSLLKINQSKKVIVFFSSCKSVKFHSELLRSIQINCLHIHGMQNQQKRTSTFFKFLNAKMGILLCPDVAARGLDIPNVDWIIQYEPPHNPKEYIHRVNRAALREGAEGNFMIFLIPEELHFRHYLEAANVPVKEFCFDKNMLENVQSHLEELVANNYHLNKLAKDAFRSFILAHSLHSMKTIFNVYQLNLRAVAASFCLSRPPKVKSIYSQ